MEAGERAHQTARDPSARCSLCLGFPTAPRTVSNTVLKPRMRSWGPLSNHRLNHEFDTEPPGLRAKTEVAVRQGPAGSATSREGRSSGDAGVPAETPTRFRSLNPSSFVVGCCATASSRTAVDTTLGGGSRVSIAFILPSTIGSMFLYRPSAALPQSSMTVSPAALVSLTGGLTAPMTMMTNGRTHMATLGMSPPGNSTSTTQR